MTAQVTSWIADLGLAGVFALMAVDAVLPAGGELVMLFAGALAAGAIAGHEPSSLAAAIAAGTLGYLAGSLAGWALGRVGGRAFIERHGRWLHLGPQRFTGRSAGSLATGRRSSSSAASRRSSARSSRSPPARSSPARPYAVLTASRR